MIVLKNKILRGATGKAFLMDVFFQKTTKKKPLVIFSHGFKGFKDWGAFNQIAAQFAEAEIVFVKYNFSHNGTTLEHPTKFGDLAAFSQNNYSKELEDLQAVIDCLEQQEWQSEIDFSNIVLMGHSRGGGISLLQAAQDERISKVISWASVCDYESRMPKEKSSIWKERETVFVYNGRTKQQMPMHYQLYENFYANKERLDIPRAAKSLKLPVLIVHGDEDKTVLLSEAKQLHDWITQSTLSVIVGADHVFNAKHPAEQNVPHLLQKVVSESIDFVFKER